MAEYEVTGVRYQMGDKMTLEERTQAAKEFISTLQNGEPVILMAEPDNQKDCEAIAVYKDYTRKVGYIKHERCKDIKPLLDAAGQCDAVVSGNDGHVTFYVEIPNAPENVVLPIERARVLPESPLPQGCGLAFSEEERILQIVAPRIAAMKLTADNIDKLLSMTERYIPLSAVSLSYDDDYWRDRVLQKLRKATRMKLPDEQKQRVKQLHDQLNKIIGNLHRFHEHPQHHIFEQQLTKLRAQTELFEKFEKYASASKDGLSAAVERLRTWFEEMPHVELRDPKDHGMLAEALSYMGVSRRELYDVYAAVLLLEKYGNATDHKAEILKEDSRSFAFMMHSGHSEEQIQAAMDGLRVVCKGKNAHAIARKLWELNKAGFILIDDEKPSNVYNELSAVFGVPNINEKAFREAFREERN